VDTMVDTKNCGDCSVTCDTNRGEACMSGRCTSLCNAGFSACAEGCCADTQIAAGQHHTCALRAGVVRCWGANLHGQLGGTMRSSTPVLVPGLPFDISAIASGGYHNCTLTAGSDTNLGASAICWGFNGAGQVGYGRVSSGETTPVVVRGLKSGAKAIVGGAAHTCALMVAGDVECWGDNSVGGLGDNTVRNSPVPVRVVGLSAKVTALAAGFGHTCALNALGGVECWGDNSRGGLGNSSETPSLTPVAALGLSKGVVAVAAGAYFTCALKAEGAVYCWGINNAYQLGGTLEAGRERTSVPTPVRGLSSGVKAIAAGLDHACALTVDGSVKCWGSLYTPSQSPLQIENLGPGVVAIAAGGRHACAVTAARGIKCWGDNGLGQLGNNGVAGVEPYRPVDVIGY
jgi:alpha-tubulin suppressor-like RCC1 family protein